jgi:radical SAM-linked protein
MRFASHRDVARAVERGVRMAGVPVAYSAGFTPHPKISYSGGAPTGAASEAEFLEISLMRRCEPADVGQRLDAALPDGIDVIDVIEADGKSAVLLEASQWEVIWPGVAPDAAALAVEAFLDAPSVEVERLTSKGLRRLDARAAVVSLQVGTHAGRRAGTDAAAGCAILRMILRQMTPAVRPDDLLTALRTFSALTPAGPAISTRLWQGSLDGAPVVATDSATWPARRGQGHGTNTAVVLTDQAGDLAGTRHPQDKPAGGPGDGLGDSPWDGTGHPEQAAQAGQLTEDAVRQRAGSAKSAPAGLARADQQLPRGARDQLAASCAREPDGRDFPHARNRATECTARFQ